MNDSNDFQPDWVSIPGDTILDILEERNLSTAIFAKQMDSSIEFINDLTKGVVEINESIALKLETILGSTSKFWLNRQRQFNTTLELLENRRTEEWTKSLPVDYLIKSGWISDSGSNIKDSLFDFFEVSSIYEWDSKYKLAVEQSYFRTSNTFDSEFASTITWLRMGEIIGRKQDCQNWNKEKFTENIDKIKRLTRIKDPARFVPTLIEFCSECGVAVAIVPTPKGCRASGATKFLDGKKALIMLSFRYLSDDHFWFTFFHEAGHLILHEDKQITYLETIDKNRFQKEKEIEANIFAGEALVPCTYHNELRNLRSNKRKIINFAMKCGVSPGIVVGQLQHLGIVKREYLNSYKRRYNWEHIDSMVTKLNQINL